MDSDRSIVTPILIPSSPTLNSLEDSDSEKVLLLEQYSKRERQSCLFYAPKTVFISMSILVFLTSIAIFSVVILYTLNLL
ncbi:hypothetical protein EHI2019_000157100 [Entamoeba histolytica]